METDSNPNFFPVGKNPPSGSAAPRRAALAQSHTNFPAPAVLEQALRASPDRRADAIEHAEPLVRDISYPPHETIEKIATLLATSLE
jgi:hypothetical protein